MYPIEYILAAILGVVALIIIVLALYYRNRNLFFQVSKDVTRYNINGRYLLYITTFFLILSAAIQALSFYRSRYQRMIQMVDSVVSILFFGIIIAIVAGVQNLYTLIALGGIIIAFIGCWIWFNQIFIPRNITSGAVPLGLALIFVCIYLAIIYMSWNDNPNRYGDNWPVTTIGFVSVICIIMLLIPVLRTMNFRNRISDNYLVPIINVASKVIFSGLLTYGVLSH